MKWGQAFRVRHITTGRYLCLDEEKGLMVLDPEKANTKLSAFCFRASKVRLNLSKCKLSILPVLLDSFDCISAHSIFFSSCPCDSVYLLIPGEQEKVEGAQKKRDVEGMGVPEIKYGESMCFMQHHSTGLWLTYAALDAKAARLGTMKRRVRSLLNHKPHETNLYT